MLPLGVILALCAAGAPCLAGETPPKEEPSVPALIAKLSHESYRVRERAFELLYIEGEDAEPALKKAAGSQDPGVRRKAKRLLFLIRWRISPALYRRIGPLWDGFDDLPVRGRLRLVRRLQCLGNIIAARILQRVSEIDPHKAVRVQARRTLAGLVIARLNGEGCERMARGEFDEAEAKFKEMLRLDPGNPIALYNLACSRSLQEDVEGALQYLRNAIRNGYRDFAWARIDKDLENLRKDPRFEKLLRGDWPGN
ncbi:MAG: TPR end-of-group domain-containing protein [Planctomycetota bacterium]